MSYAVAGVSDSEAGGAKELDEANTIMYSVGVGDVTTDVWIDSISSPLIRLLLPLNGRKLWKQFVP
ncbi:MAG: hypothetical protein U7123_03050 [Potamolinea sp.]